MTLSNVCIDPASAEQPAPSDAAPTLRPSAAGRALYTRFAGEALDLAELLNAGLARHGFGYRTRRHFAVGAPVGPSTASGRFARLSISVVSEDEPLASVSCGFLDVRDRRAEVRRYDEVAAQFRARVGASFPVVRADFERAREALARLLSDAGFGVTCR